VIFLHAAISIVAFISFPITTFSAIMFGAVSGLTGSSTCRRRSGAGALMFARVGLRRCLSAFVTISLGASLGVPAWRIVFETFLHAIWLLSVLFGLLRGL